MGSLIDASGTEMSAPKPSATEGVEAGLESCLVGRVQA